MKNIIYILILSLFYSCEKKEDIQEPIKQNCNCGKVVDYGAHYQDQNQIITVWWVDVVNNCTNNIERKVWTWHLSTAPTEYIEAKNTKKYCFGYEW